MADTLQGYRRSDGRLGARNHVLVLPSVVCAGLAAELIGEAGAVAVVHQHGCGQVGDDVAQTERAFIGFATNPNVGGVVTVSLGCETIQGRRLANRIAERGQRVEFTGIQALGGTANTVDRGREAVARLRALLAGQERVAAGLGDLRVGIAGGDGGPLAEALLQMLLLRGARVAVAGSRPGAVEIDYGESASAPVVAVRHAGAGSEQLIGLAGTGAQVIVALRGRGQAALGLAGCPVVAVAGDSEMFTALEDDFDIDGGGDPVTTAGAIVERIVTAFNGEETASEKRGARDFVMRRVARTM